MGYKRKAAALKYDMNNEAPVISAAGVGQIAENIIKRAEENEVPIVYNKELTDFLCNLDVGDSIPEELYEAVAHVIAYITDIDEKI
ncbi:MAG: EscU/YscU/HrcU family type III secretion system export apparatus switch protein [Clostridium sp.]|uniref:EscU/YscU/HrcU family type III secretion system export apparatus switch protein n=1 Tax=Clostridium sp. TaxID=1506 RepID=UPI003F365B30